MAEKFEEEEKQRVKRVEEIEIESGKKENGMMRRMSMEN